MDKTKDLYITSSSSGSKNVKFPRKIMSHVPKNFLPCMKLHQDENKQQVYWIPVFVNNIAHPVNKARVFASARRFGSTLGQFS